MVRKERLELSQVTLLEPKSSASTNSATFAFYRPELPINDHRTTQTGDYTLPQHYLSITLTSSDSKFLNITP